MRNFTRLPLMPVPYTVRLLSLRTAGLTGPLTGDWLLSLKNVVALDLSYNRLTGRLPDELGQMTQLRALMLNGNGMFMSTLIFRSISTRLIVFDP